MAGIRSSLAEAAATAASPTTGIAAAAQDEVSLAIASMFGSYGKNFQALSAQAQAFHQQFVQLMNAGAGAYAGAEAANAAEGLLGGGFDGGIVGSVNSTLSALEGGGGLGAAVSGQIQANIDAVSSAIVGAPAALSGAIQTGGQAISKAVSGFEAGVGALQAGGAPGLITSANAFANAVAAPYQALAVNTFNNLQSIGNTLVGNPFPILHQLVNNQIFYGETIATAIGAGIQNLPAELANLPATIQAGFQQLLSFNPAFYVQQFVNQQIGYAQTIATGLVAVPQDFANGLLGLPASFQAAGQALVAGDPVLAANLLGQGFESVALPGFNVANPATGIATITPTGPLGDLLPILSIPGQMAQNFTNLLPPSIPRMVAQNFTDLVQTLTSTANTLDIINGTLTFGLPLEAIFDGIGAPINALSALNSSAVAVETALQAGNVGAAVAAGLGAPAVVANGFLNGTTLLSLPLVSLAGLGAPDIFSLVEIPFGGLLTPLSLPPLFLVSDGQAFQLTLAGGTGFGGLIPGMLNIGAELAQAIALPAPTLPL
ncbi:PE family protein [Mycobacterium palustre]|nr:PE family protein [Mycobacterium palustre]